MSFHPPLQHDVEHRLLYTSKERFQEEAVSQGEMFIDEIKSGSVVLRLRPITDQAVQTLLDAKKNNNKLVHMILGILKQINIPEMLNDSGTLDINVQVCYASQEVLNQGKIIHLFCCFITRFKFRTFYIYISLHIVIDVFQQSYIIECQSK